MQGTRSTLTVALSSLLLGAGIAVARPSLPPGGPSAIGSWEDVGDSQLMIVHGALTYTGKLIMWSGELEQGLRHTTLLFDPLTNDQTVITPPLDDDIFCAGHVQMADGRIFVNGGDGSIRTQNYIFDPATETWTQVADMENGRWYPTVVALGDGRLITFSGWGGIGDSDQLEIYTPDTDSWETLPSSADRELHIYPSMHLMPNGKLFYSGTRWNGGEGWNNPPPSAYFDPETNTWENLVSHVEGDRSEGFAFLVPDMTPGAEPWQVMVAGGYCGDDNQRSAEVIDLSDPDPQWQVLPLMNKSRNNANGVILPDGKVLFPGGIQGFKWNGDRVDSLEGDLWDPATVTWTMMATQTHPSQYHSIALLLPDGRVFKGGGHDGPGVNLHQMEIYSPPYLFNGPRPTITDAPDSVGYGLAFEITSPEAGDIAAVTLVKLGQITHHTNSDQRLLSLVWNATDPDTIIAFGPAHANMAPPGYYMLFVINANGVPSLAEMVKVEEIKVPPCVADLTGDGIVGTADLLDLLSQWGTDPGGPPDFNGDMNVGTSDLLQLLSDWGACPK